MDTLPQSNKTQPLSVPQPAYPIGSVAKEQEIAQNTSAESVLQADGSQEIPLSSEVARAGVRMHAETIELPKPVQQLGVTVVPQAPVAPIAVVPIALPLTDEQIADGLGQSITSSIRWLAEWCERRLKEFHFAVKNAGTHAVKSKP